MKLERKRVLKVKITNPNEFSNLFLSERLGPRKKLFNKFYCNPFGGFGEATVTKLSETCVHYRPHPW